MAKQTQDSIDYYETDGNISNDDESHYEVYDDLGDSQTDQYDQYERAQKNDNKAQTEDHVYETVTESKPRAIEEPVTKCTKKHLLLLSFLFLIILTAGGVVLALVLSTEEHSSDLPSKGVEDIKKGNISETFTNWISIGSDCFKFVVDACEEGCSWEHSNDVCSNLGGKLAEPKTSLTMQKLMDHAKQSEELKKRSYWIGLTFQTKQKIFAWTTTDTIPADIDQRFWAKNEPSHDGPYVHFFKNSMLLNDRPEIDKNKPICQKPVLTVTGKCGEGWTYHAGQCYRFMINKCKNSCSWFKAHKICKEEGAILAEGPDLNFLQNQARTLDSHSNWWIGFSDLKKEGTFVRESDGEYVNLDGYFVEGQPDNYKNSQHWLELNYNYGLKLRDRTCEIENPYQPLCQKQSSGGLCME